MGNEDVAQRVAGTRKIPSFVFVLFCAGALLEIPFASSASSPIVGLSIGSSHTCAATSTGGVQCWGRNVYGQLGDNSSTNSSVPVTVSGLSSDVTSVAAGDDHTCALMTTGGVQCWGRNLDGQLGNNSKSDSSVPVTVSGLSSGVTAIAAGRNHTCAVTSTGGVQCWGRNVYGQLGNNSSTNSSVPVMVSGLSSGVTAIAAEAGHTCALMTTGGVQCWGANLFGQLGNRSKTDSSVPVTVSGLSSGVTAIAAGRNHTCALMSTGGVQCWGDNSSGQLGNNTRTDSSVPVTVSGLLSRVTAIAAGRNHTCALMTTGDVRCWGANLFGQLGKRLKTDSSVPVTVSGLSIGVTAITAGGSHTCALTSTGGVQCWGDNSSGQLGNNSKTDSPARW